VTRDRWFLLFGLVGLAIAFYNARQQRDLSLSILRAVSPTLPLTLPVTADELADASVLP
jgi:hypothetical protein